MKIILLRDIDGNQHRIDPDTIDKIVPDENHLRVETTDGIIITNCDKLILENSIHNCYLP